MHNLLILTANWRLSSLELKSLQSSKLQLRNDRTLLEDIQDSLVLPFPLRRYTSSIPQLTLMRDAIFDP